MIRSICNASNIPANWPVSPSGAPQRFPPVVAPVSVASVRSRLARLLAEPEVRLIMKADGVDEAELLAMLTAISAKLLRQKSMDPGESDA